MDNEHARRGDGFGFLDPPQSLEWSHKSGTHICWRGLPKCIGRAAIFLVALAQVAALRSTEESTCEAR